MSLSWLFHQHVDHVIPIQKLMQTSLLRLSGFDFRILRASNLLTACIISFVLIGIAKEIRGRLLFGDLVLVPLMFNFGFGVFNWGFHWQFESSILFFTIAILLFCYRLKPFGAVYCFAGSCSILFCMFTGLNGLILSTTFSFCLLLIELVIIYRNRRFEPLSSFIAFLMTLLILIQITIWLNWEPSTASSTTFSLNFSYLLDFLKGLAQAPFGILPRGNYPYYWVVVFSVCLTVYTLNRFWSANGRTGIKTYSTVVIYAAMGSVLTLIVALAIGRSRYHVSWNVGLAMHYGYLTTLLPYLCWLMVSKNFVAKRMVINVYSVILIACFTHAFFVAAKWQLDYVGKNLWKIQETTAAISGQAPSEEVAVRYIDNLYFVKNDHTVSIVKHGIDYLRSEPGSVYYSK
jgi:hypothetical protein